jgi:hypothetical protein
MLSGYLWFVLYRADIEQLLREKKPFILPCMRDSIKKLQGRGVQWGVNPTSVLPGAISLESREMLGRRDNLRYNGLCHSSATRTRRSSRMRVKLQLVLYSDEGQEETVTDVITLNKNPRRIEHLGLTLAEAKQLLSTLQRHLLQHQVDTFLDSLGFFIFPVPEVPITQG